MNNRFGIIALACLMLVFSAGSFETNAQVTNGRMAFVRGGDIYTAESNGANAVNLTNSAAFDGEPNYSSDGTKILFSSNRDGNTEIYLMNSDGSNPVRLTTNTASDINPSFSSDGTKIVFVSARDGNLEIYTMNSDGSNPVRLTNNTVNDLQPRFSPDGGKIVLSRDVVSPPGGFRCIFTINAADGSGEAQLTTPSFTSDYAPSYSPNGTRILYHRLSTDSFISRAAVMNTDGSNQGVYFQKISSVEGSINSLIFSPDGTKILYTEQSTFSSPIRYRVVTYTLSNGAKDILFDNGENPSWQPVRPAIARKPFDFDGDGKTDHAIFRPSTGEWWIQRSSDGSNYVITFGIGTDKIVPADYTGDGKTDIAVWRPSTGEWFVLRSEDYSYYSYSLGASGDIPQAGDFDGDGKADTAIFRPSTGQWFILRSSDLNYTISTFGVNTDIPVTADYDGDGKADIAIYRRSTDTWWLNRSRDGVGAVTLPIGIEGEERAVTGDFTGDGKADFAVNHSGQFYIIRSENNSWFGYNIAFGSTLAAPGDYDGDGIADGAIYEPSSGTWRVRQTTTGIISTRQYGVSTDIPVPSAFIQ